MSAASRPRRRWPRRVLLALAVVLLAVVGVVVAMVVRTRADQELVLPDGPWPTTPSTLVADGRLSLSETAVLQGSARRAAAVLVPTDRRPGERLPAVVVLHGRGGSPQSILEGGAWAPALAERRIVGVFPRGEGESWNAGRCCRPATTLGIDDEAFLGALLDELARRPDVDPERIHLVGDSNGGMMAYRMLCRRTASLAGVASVMGTDVSGCEPGAGPRLLHAAGTGDEVVPYEGGTTTASLVFADGPFPPVEEQVAGAADAARCGDPPSTESGGPVRTTEWSGCAGGSTIRLVTLVGAPHEWPRGVPWDATEEILDYFGLPPEP